MKDWIWIYVLLDHGLGDLVLAAALTRSQTDLSLRTTERFVRVVPQKARLPWPRSKPDKSHSSLDNRSCRVTISINI